MTELWKIVRKYLILSIITVLMTMIICGIIIAKTNTDAMLFG